MKSILLLIVLFSVQAFSQNMSAPLQILPVQEGGRVKPFDTFARESLQFIYGKQKYEDAQGKKRSAIEIVMTWMLVPEHWENQKILQINHKGLKTALQLNENDKYFAPGDLLRSSRLPLVLQDLNSKREMKEKLDPYYQAAQRLEGQLGLFHALRRGDGFHVAPPLKMAAPTSEAPAIEGKWQTVLEIQGEVRDKFSVMTAAFVRALPLADDLSTPEKKDAALQAQAALETAVKDYMTVARAQNPEAYGVEKDINLEVHLNRLQPFQKSWILYLLAAIVMGVAWQSNKKSVYRFAWILAGAAFCLHIYGFVLRMYLTGRPPVSNMYESVIWVSFGTMLFGMIFEALRRQKYVLLGSSIVACLCLIVADFAPNILDPSLQPLEPVLRDNMWLTVHVLTITISYSAFFLALILGDIGLFYILKGDSPNTARVREIVQSTYRCVQVGVVLLAAGIILGGVWADYSWGRFWGWDPKETMALVALLGYLAILHGRLAGWVKNFGMLMGAVVSFGLVLMAWYGVNYILGAGLHSYGFGAGGVEYVVGFILLHVLYCGYVGYVNFVRGNMEQTT